MTLVEMVLLRELNRRIDWNGGEGKRRMDVVRIVLG